MRKIPISISQSDCLFRVIDMHPEGFVSEPKWRNSISTIVCPYCKNIDRNYFPSPVDGYTLSAPRQIFGGSITMVGLGVRHRDFIEQVGSESDRLAIGRLYDKHGNSLDEYVTCYCNEEINLHSGDGHPDNTDLCRGTKYNICWRCKSIYCDSGTIQPYVLRYELSGRDLYYKRSGSVFITSTLKDRIDWSRWPTVDFTRIEIRDELLPDDPWPLYEKAYRELKTAFGGNYQAALNAVESEIDRLKLPDKVQYVPVIICGIKLLVEAWIHRGSARIQTLRIDTT